MKRLESWKEIAQHLNRTVRTVQRWEQEQGLPVHRLPHNKLASVFAYPNELDEWWEKRRQSIESDETPTHVEPAVIPPAPVSRRRWPQVAILGLALAAVAAALWVGLDRLRRPTESDRLYAAGRQRWNDRSQAGFREALDLFQRSIAANPSNARAYSGLADTYALLDAFSDLPRAETLPNAHAAAAKSVQLGDSLGEPHASLSFVLWAEGDRDGAFREIERAIALNPNYATSIHWYALYLQDSGRHADAVVAAQRAHALAPDSMIIASDLAIVLRNAGRAAESTALLEELVAKHPTFPEANLQLAEAYRIEGQYAKAAEQVNRAVQNGDVRPTTQARRAWLYAQTGDLRNAVDALTRFRSMQKQGEYVPPLALLEAVTAAGDIDFAFRIIEQATRANEDWVKWIQGGDGSLFKQLTADPRWQALKPRLAAVITSSTREEFDAATIGK